jgi:hypothetical protein
VTGHWLDTYRPLWTEERLRAPFTLRRKGLSVPAISKRLGVSKNAVLGQLYRHSDAKGLSIVGSTMTRIVRSTYRYKRCLILGISGLLGVAITGSSLAADTFDGVYGGKRVLTKGSGSECPTDEAVSVTIHSQALRFTNSAFRNFVMGFRPRPDGSFGGISTGRGGSVLIQGRMVGNALDADVVSGSCEHHWHLTKQPP